MKMKRYRAQSLYLALAVASMRAPNHCCADVIGWTSTRREVMGGHLINVFAVTDNPLDRIVSVMGGNPGQATSGFVVTNSPGGFKQALGDTSVFAPTGWQSWTTLDSFLSVGGTYLSSTDTWTGWASSVGDMRWMITYTDSTDGSAVSANSFNEPSNNVGFWNPNLHTVPQAGGWYLPGVSSPARDLRSLSEIRCGYGSVNGLSFGSSSRTASEASHGFLVAQLFVNEWGGIGLSARFIDWKMTATVVRPDGSLQSGTFQFRIGEFCVGDFDGDSVVDGVDLGVLLGAWGPCDGGCAADINGDGTVDGIDLGGLLAAWGDCEG
jgi:hypothetical protein